MSVLTYKCPNCGGYLVFEPETQHYTCPYCLSDFAQTELDTATSESEDIQDTEENTQEQEGQVLIYTCPSCGAEIATDTTTAATFCYYCHNPIVLSGRLSGEQMPSLIIPFQISKEEAKKRFLSWIGSKAYVPPDFYSPAQIEKLSGIYFPYWTLDCTLQADMHATARNVRIWRSHDIEYTETKTYAIHRLGEISLTELSRNALTKSQSKMLEGILPFDLKKTCSFHLGYLAGFQAEVKDIEKESLLPELQEEINGYAKSLLSDTLASHQHITTDSFQTYNAQHIWKYLLLPVWILTYQHRSKTYYFAMNGQTGEICGRLPLYKRKLFFTCAGIFVVVTALITLIGGLL